jgi:hypothetical protein
MEKLPIMCKDLKIEVHELTFNDFTQIVSTWLIQNDMNASKETH